MLRQFKKGESQQNLSKCIDCVDNDKICCFFSYRFNFPLPHPPINIFYDDCKRPEVEFNDYESINEYMYLRIIGDATKSADIEIDKGNCSDKQNIIPIT